MKAIFKYSAIACATLLIASSAMAMSFTIDDSKGKDSTGGDAAGWNNWNNAGGPRSDKDIHGTPAVDSMTINYQDSLITSIVVSLEAGTPTRQYFDSLFINTNYTAGSKWDAWNYYAINGVNENNNEQFIKGGDVIQTDGFYLVKKDYTYLYAENGGSRNGSSTTINKSGIDDGDLKTSPIAYDIEFKKNITTGLYDITYSFRDGLRLDGGFFVAYAPWCANDVVGGGKAMDPVPEPTTMLLFGTGIAGLAGIGRRKMRK